MKLAHQILQWPVAVPMMSQPRMTKAGNAAHRAKITLCFPRDICLMNDVHAYASDYWFGRNPASQEQCKNEWSDTAGCFCTAIARFSTWLSWSHCVFKDDKALWTRKCWSGARRWEGRLTVTIGLTDRYYVFPWTYRRAIRASHEKSQDGNPVAIGGCASNHRPNQNHHTSDE